MSLKRTSNWIEGEDGCCPFQTNTKSAKGKEDGSNSIRSRRIRRRKRRRCFEMGVRRALGDKKVGKGETEKREKRSEMINAFLFKENLFSLSKYFQTKNVENIQFVLKFKSYSSNFMHIFRTAHVD